MDGYVLREPPNRYEPVLAVAALVVEHVTISRRVVLPVEGLRVVRFQPVFTDRWVCVYGANDGSPRERMRRDALLRGERCRTHPYMRIAEAGCATR